jgi:phosphinothricin acetyltransferase
MSHTVISIRPACIEDVPAILDIVNYSILHTTANYNYDILSLETQLQWFADKQARNYPVIVAEHNGQTVGFGTYGMFRKKSGTNTP